MKTDLVARAARYQVAYARRYLLKKERIIMEKRTIWIVYFSPAGTTKQVAEVISKEAENYDGTVISVDLSSTDSGNKQIIDSIGDGDVLFVGSPVYANHPVPLVMDFISKLPDNSGAFAAAFVTYGAVTSGVSLYDMARAMDAKSLLVLGGIKVVAVHSMLWLSPDPLGKGRPNEEDKMEVRRFARAILDNASGDKPKTIALSKLNYQSQEVRDIAKESGLHVLKPLLFPFDLDEGKCTECSACVEHCPVDNIALDPLPIYADQCVLCFNCIRMCEPGAISSKAMPFIEEEIHNRLATYKEPQRTTSFL